jgi:Holliday junction resolvase RusA-like endonuclease
VGIRLKDQTALDALLGHRPSAKPGRGKPAQFLTKKAPAPVRLLEPGTVIAAFEVTGQPVPWRAPLRGRGKHVRTEPHVKAWKETVARAAEAAGLGESAGIPPYEGPVEVELYACRSAKARKPGERWVSKPDGDNLFKLIADAISGNVFKAPGKDPVTGKRIIAAHMPPSPVGRIIADDKLIADPIVHKRYWTRPLAYIIVRAAGRIDAGPYPFAP